MKRTRYISLALILFAAAVSSAGADDDVSAALIQAFRHGNAGALQAYFPPEGRVHLAIAAVDITRGSYSSRQAVALLQQAFQAYEIVSYSPEPRSGVIRGEWIVRSRTTKTSQTVTLYISIQTGGNKPVIKSIQGG